MRTLSRWAAVLALSSCQPSVQRMTAEEVRSTFVNTTDYGTYANGRPFASYVAPDGAITMQREGQVSVGRYRIDGDGQFCVHYEASAQTTDVCQSMWKGVNRYYSTLSDGRPGVTITSVKPGMVGTP